MRGSRSALLLALFAAPWLLAGDAAATQAFGIQSADRQVVACVEIASDLGCASDATSSTAGPWASSVQVPGPGDYRAVASQDTTLSENAISGEVYTVAVLSEEARSSIDILLSPDEVIFL